MIELRRANQADREYLNGVAWRAKAHWQYPAEWLESWRDQLTLTEDYLNRHHVFVAQYDKAILGFTAVIPLEDGIWEIDHLWIDPPFMGRGAGRLLYQKALETVRGEGAPRLMILSDPNARPFYERMGAVLREEVPSSIPGRSLPLMEVILY